MAYCLSKISADIEASCTNPIYAGLKSRAFIINKEDISSYTISDNVISAISLEGTAKAFQIQVMAKTPFDGTQNELAEGNVKNKFNKTVHFLVANDGASFRKNVIDKLANGRFVVVVEHEWNDATGNSAFEVIGWHTGLKGSAMTQSPSSEDADGGWDITLVESGAPTSGVYFFHTDVTTSRADLEALC